MSNFLKPYVCTQCGGKVNRATLVCENCGTQFKENDGIIRIIAERPGVHTLGTAITIDEEMLYAVGAKEISEIVMKQMVADLAEAIAPYIEVKTERSFISNQQIVRGRVRVLDSSFRFS